MKYFSLSLFSLLIFIISSSAPSIKSQELNQQLNDEQIQKIKHAKKWEKKARKAQKKNSHSKSQEYYSKAFTIFLEIAHSGSSSIQEKVADYYYHNTLQKDYRNNLSEQNKDLGRALYWYKKAAPYNIKAATMLFNIGVSHKNTELYNSALQNITKLAEEKNDSEALYNLGNLYREGIYVPKNYNKAYYYYNKAIDISNKKGNPGAFTNLGIMYLTGEGIQKNEEYAIKLITIAAEKNYLPACKALANYHNINKNYNAALNLYLKLLDLKEIDKEIFLKTALLYQYGNGCEQDYQKAIFYHNQAFKMGCIESCYNLGLIYETGEIENQPPYKAVEFYKITATLGHIESQARLGFLYLNSKTENTKEFPNYQEAFKWLSKVAPAYDEAYFALANLYLEGKGVERNPKKAFKIYQKLAEKGVVKAFYNLGEIYYKGNYLGFNVKRNVEKAYYYYNKAWEEAKLPLAATNLAIMYQEGEKSTDGKTFIVKKDFQKALELFEYALKYDSIIAQVRLGTLYLLGEQVEKNALKGIDLLTKAAEKNVNNASVYTTLGCWWCSETDNKPDYKKALCYLEKAYDLKCPTAAYMLGTLYERGGEIEQNYTKAAFYYKAASKLNHSNAQNSLALLYKKGNGVKKSYKKALYWFTQSAKHNLPYALYNIGQLYRKGQGVSIDYHTAYNYYYKGAKLGHDFSAIKLGFYILEGKHNPKDISSIIRFLKSVKDTTAQVNAYYILGLIYFRISGTKADYYKKSLNYFTQAANLNHPDACLQLAKIYLKEDSKYTNCSKGIQLIQKAAELKYSKAYSMLGKIYLSGYYVKQDYTKAYYYLKQAALQNDPEGLYYLALLKFDKVSNSKEYRNAYNLLEKSASYNYKEAQYLMGELCGLNTQNLNPDHPQALTWYKRCALQGDKRALLKIYYMHKSGHNSHINTTHAFKLLEKAAEQPALEEATLEAQMLLAYCYDQGIDCAKNPTLSNTYYLKAAFNNYIPAMLTLAKRYLYQPANNRFTTKDAQEKAQYWLKKAALLGSEEAQRELYYLSYNEEE